MSKLQAQKLLKLIVLLLAAGAIAFLLIMPASMVRLFWWCIKIVAKFAGAGIGIAAIVFAIFFWVQDFRIRGILTEAEYHRYSILSGSLYGLTLDERVEFEELEEKLKEKLGHKPIPGPWPK